MGRVFRPALETHQRKLMGGKVQVTDPISTEDAAAVLDVTKQHVALLCRQGTLTAVQLSGAWLVSAKSVQAYKRVQATKPAVGWKAKSR